MTVLPLTVVNYRWQNRQPLTTAATCNLTHAGRVWAVLG